MIQALIFAAVLAAAPVEEPVDPYIQSDANAGTAPFEGEAMLKAFHGRVGIDRVVDATVDRSIADPRIRDIFEGHDLVRLRRTVKEQFCYILNGGCAYSGRDMAASHKDLGLQNADFNAFVEHLQAAMDHEGVGFRAQNRFLAKLAPMQRTTVER